MTTQSSIRLILTACPRATGAGGGLLPGRLTLSLCLFVLLALGPATSFASSADSLQRQGVAAYQQGNYEQALELFNEALEAAPDSPIALYNKGTALYKLGRYEEAAARFAESSRGQSKAKPRARAAYNQGRALLSAAEATQGAAKKEKLLTSQHAFQQALRDNPQLTAARQGIEELRQALAALDSKQPPAQSQPQQRNNQGNSQQGQQQQGQDMDKQLDEAARQQEEMARQSQSAGSATSSQSPSQEQLQEMAEKQQSVRQSLEAIKDKLQQEANQEDGEGRSQQLAEELSKAIADQKEAEKALQEGRLDQARQQQEQAAERLSQLAAGPDGNQEDKGEPSGAAAVPENKDTDASQELEELQARPGDSTVRDILDGEEALHEMRRLRMQRQQPAGGKDW